MMMNPAYRVTPDNGYDKDTTEDAAKDAAKDAAENAAEDAAEDAAKEAAKDVAEEDKDAAEDESVPSLETDLSSYDDQTNILGTGGRSSTLRDHVDHEDQDCPQPFDERALTPPYLLVSGILLDAMEPSYMSSSIQPGRRYWTSCSCRF